ncbi:MAG: hypothetical protein HKN41_13410, partial [Ilumatobacter sp.]|nr:hypothetical protein [Ilumatobacter sp.]
MSGVDTRRVTSSGRAGAAWLVAVFGLGACGGAAEPRAVVVGDVPETVAIGGVPEPLGDTVPLPSVVAPTTAPESTTTTAAPRAPITGPVGDEVFGNRVLLIGDTVLASTAPRFDGVMCDALEAFGWQAEIAAEVGRFVDFGLVVTEELLDPG